MNILEEANSLVHGDRRAVYGHPLDDYTRTAGMVSAMLADKLKGELTAEDMILVMCCVKLSRQVNAPKRDNMTDLAGYAACEQMTIEERAKRSAPQFPFVLLPDESPGTPPFRNPAAPLDIDGLLKKGL